MTAPKIRRVDFWPSDWITGTSQLTFEQKGLYWDVCAAIYDGGGPVKNDPRVIGRRAAGCGAARARRLIGELIAVGKLALTDDGRLTNGRSERELTLTGQRVASAKHASESARISRENRAKTERESNETRAENSEKPNEINETGENPDHPAISYQLSATSKKESARSNERATRARKATDAEQQLFPIENGVDHGDEQRHRLARDWRPSEGQREFAESLGLEADAIAESFVLWWVEGKGQHEQRTDSGWGLTWNGWCRRDAERSGRGATTRNGSGVRPADGGGLAGAAARLRARYREQ